MLRLHSKSVLKLNATHHHPQLIFHCSYCCHSRELSFKDNASLYNEGPNPPTPLTNGTNLNPCQLVEIKVEIFQIYWASQMIFSIFFLVWNLLVAVVLVSVARTQVTNI